jgi:large subunit ribosomal protein L3
MKFILGKKIEMTQRFKEDGRVVPVTVVASGPCSVTQIKSSEKDGYRAVQIGYDKKKKINKPLKGHLKGLDNFRYVKEFRIEESVELKHGDKITVGVFQPGDIVSVVGTSKGKGFQGVVKRHGFKGGPGSHGDKDQHRAPGSIGATDAARVFKGMRMAGHMGDSRATVTNLEIVEIDPEKNLLFIKGAVPGARGSLLLISAPGEIQLSRTEDEKKEKSVEKSKEEPKKRTE